MFCAFVTLPCLLWCFIYLASFKSICEVIFMLISFVSDRVALLNMLKGGRFQFTLLFFQDCDWEMLLFSHRELTFSAPSQSLL